MTSTTNSKANYAALAATLFLLASVPTHAVAGACKNNSRMAWPTTQGEARTRVKNQTSAKALTVTLERGSSEKSTQTIQPGDEFSKLVKFSSNSGSGTITVTIEPDPGYNGSKCVYEIDKGDNYIKWQLPSDAEKVCPVVNEMKVSCEKGYNKDKTRFTTTYTVTDSA